MEYRNYGIECEMCLSVLGINSVKNTSDCLPPLHFALNVGNRYSNIRSACRIFKENSFKKCLSVAQCG